MNAVDRYIEDLASSLHVSNRARARILAETRDHLDDAVAFHQRAGESLERASERALEAFGACPLIATQFNAEAGTRAMRRAPIVAITAGAGVFAGLVVAGRSQPHPAIAMNAVLATQVSFFASVLAFQLAVVAGICAASRALAVRRAPVPRGADRLFVRRAAMIATTALGIAATGWAITVGLAVNRLTHPNTVAAVGGGAIMLGSAILAVAVTFRLRVNPSDIANSTYTDERDWFGLGEQALGLVRRHPVVSCTVVATLSAMPAMAHAETTFAGALPWGATQAAAVVLAVIALGPTLGLRRVRMS